MRIDPERRGALGKTITKSNCSFGERKETEVCIVCSGTVGGAFETSVLRWKTKFCHSFKLTQVIPNTATTTHLTQQSTLGPPSFSVPARLMG